jgi:ABC-type multidrug transport system fused ATPase/permease subunit
MSFFDSTPIGRVINRFSKDLDDIDVQLPSIFEQLLQNLLLIVTSIAVVGYAIPYFLVAVPFILVFYIWLVKYFRPTQREAKRLDNLSRSPLFSQLTGTLV